MKTYKLIKFNPNDAYENHNTYDFTFTCHLNDAHHEKKKLK